MHSCLITFSPDDQAGVEAPHTDATVIMAVINDYKVEILLINDDGSVNLLPYNVFKKVEIRDVCLLFVCSHLRGINDIPIRVEGKVLLPITIGEEFGRGEVRRGNMTIVEFIVAKVFTA